MCIHCGRAWGGFHRGCDRGSASNQVLVKEFVEKINKMNNNSLVGLDGVCLKTEGTWGETVEPLTMMWVLKLMHVQHGWTNSWKKKLLRVIRHKQLWKLQNHGSLKPWEILWEVEVSVWPQVARFCGSLPLTPSFWTGIHPVPCTSHPSTCLIAENCSTVRVFRNITQIWPFTKSCFNPVQLLIAVSLLAVVSRSLNTSGVCVLQLKLSGRNSTALLEERHLLSSAFSLEKGWIRYNLPASCFNDDKNFTALLPVYLASLCPRYDNVCRSRRNNEIYGKQARRRKRHFTVAALFPAVVGLQMGTEFATKAEKHLNFIY